MLLIRNIFFKSHFIWFFLSWFPHWTWKFILFLQRHLGFLLPILIFVSCFAWILYAMLQNEEFHAFVSCINSSIHFLLWSFRFFSFSSLVTCSLWKICTIPHEERWLSFVLFYICKNNLVILCKTENNQSEVLCLLFFQWWWNICYSYCCASVRSSN